MVLSDQTTTLECHTRRVHLADGPIISTKKSRLTNRKSFQVTHLVLKWYGDLEPENVTAYGHYIDKKGRTINCRRVYTYDNIPKWMREPLGREA